MNVSTVIVLLAALAAVAMAVVNLVKRKGGCGCGCSGCNGKSSCRKAKPLDSDKPKR